MINEHEFLVSSLETIGYFRAQKAADRQNTLWQTSSPHITFSLSIPYSAEEGPSRHPRKPSGSPLQGWPTPCPSTMASCQPEEQQTAMGTRTGLLTQPKVQTCFGNFGWVLQYSKEIIHGGSCMFAYNLQITVYFNLLANLPLHYISWGYFILIGNGLMRSCTINLSDEIQILEHSRKICFGWLVIFCISELIRLSIIKHKFYKVVAGFLIYWQLLVWVFTKIFSYRTVY